jgi:hypothetical protein
MPWVAVDNTTGNVFVTYFCMENLNNFNTNTFVAAAVNGFATFQNRIVSDVAHVTARIPGFGGGYAGDYIGITANGGRGFAAWMDDRNGTWQNYVLKLEQHILNLLVVHNCVQGLIHIYYQDYREEGRTHNTVLYQA